MWTLIAVILARLSFKDGRLSPSCSPALALKSRDPLRAGLISAAPLPFEACQAMA